MKSKQFVKCLLVLLAVALFAANLRAAVIVTLQANGLLPGQFGASADATGVGTNTGTFTVSRSDTLTTSVTIQLAVSGTAVPGVDYVPFPTNITLAANVGSSNLTVQLETGATITAAKTVVLSLLTSSAYFPGLNTNAVITLVPLSDLTNSVPSPVGRYWRGSGSDPTYWSQVIPLDYETGVIYSNMFGNCSNLYNGLPCWAPVTVYHYNATNTLSQTNIANRIPFNNPIVAFGERVGGSPLYINQEYNFGVYAGIPTTPTIEIQVYNQSGGYAGYTLITAAGLYNANYWNTYVTNGFQVTGTNYNASGVVTNNNFGLTTILSTTPSLAWGASQGGGLVLSHIPSAQATNYIYVVEEFGYATRSPTTNAMAIASGSLLPAQSFLYTMEFEQRPAWRSVVLDQPFFDGSPLPPFYAGKSVEEMLTNTPPVTNVVSFTPSAATNLDDSPELRRHPILDNFVASMGNDPIALANYVINQIDLTDPMDYSDSGNVAEQSIDPGGVSRGALGTFLEKQGSATEQCALLVYLLRQAGVPAVYEFAPRNGIQILDSRLSRMLKFQVQGGFTEGGQLYTTNTMIAVNYPWVAAYIGTNWVHIFPWLKDYQIVEGLDLWEEMPTNYANAYPLVSDYIYAKTNLLSLAADGDNTLRVIFPAYLKQTLLQNHPGISVDDVGDEVFNRQHYYSRWQDFPTPTCVTNISTALESLTDTNLAGISPTLTNIFDTVSVEIYSSNNPAADIQTGDLRLCDLHDREFYIYQFVTNSGVQLNLTLLPFRTNITAQFAFANDSNLLSREVLSLTLGSSDDGLGIRFRYHRHRAISPAYAIDPDLAFMGINGFEEVDLERPFRKGDQAAICINYGRVTDAMLNVHATDIWQMENTLRANPSLTNSISPDVYIGATMYLAGLQYYEKVGEFDQVNQHLNKVNILSEWAAGLSKISPARDSSGNLLNGKIAPIEPNVDMFYCQTAIVGNGTLKPNSGENFQLGIQNYNLMFIADSSAEEHQVINRFYQQTNAVSTVRLLQLAQSRGQGIATLTLNNYASQGNVIYQGQTLGSFDSSIWQTVTNTISTTYGTTVAYMPHGAVTNSAYKGMAALILGWGTYAALISPSGINGGFGEDFPSLTTMNPVNLDYLNLNYFNDDFSITLNQPTTGSTLAPMANAPVDLLSTYQLVLGGTYTLDSYDTLWSADSSSEYGLPSSGTQNQIYAATLLQTQQSGDQGQPNSPWYSRILDPVSPITGEFYVDETDMLLPGPLPLALTRHYSSQNLADNQFGVGWRLNLMPYLVVSSGSTNIFASEMDGSMFVYVRTATNANVWIPTPAANPQLNNDTEGTGGLANRLRNSIVQSVNGTTTNFNLYGADGSVRAFQVTTFNNGITNQTRPYLQQWTDNRGNYYTFTYGTNSSQPNFGQVVRIQSSNGNFLGFDYDIFNHMIDAYTGDGRWLYYEYDEYGDLVTITLPDNTTRSYQYQHATQAVTGGTATYSTHLLIEADKPDGRALINAYDNQRRVTNQLSTAGADLNPIRTGTFIFTNSFNITNSYTTPISGHTLIIDGNGHTNRYDYTNSLITKITDPLGQTVQQTWYADNATAPGYPRSLATTTDKRGLVTQYQYDGNGNVTNTIITGDLTGDGITSQTATNTASYNSNNLPMRMTDAAGNSIVVQYDPVFNFQPQEIIRFAGASPVSTNFFLYGNGTNVVVNGNTTQTNVALGLVTRQIRAYGSPDAATNDMAYDGHGFPTQSTAYTSTGDPNIVKTLYYNERGDPISAVDALGAETFMDYDALDRPIEKENFDEFGNPLSWSFNYYDDNGELNWVDGPRYNPEDYIFYDYDGEGRITTEIRWVSQANSDGSGMSAPSGYNQYAQTFYQFDPVDNQILKVDPRGGMTTNTYDALNRLVQQRRLNFDDVTVLSAEGFGYEPGGQVQYHTNALGGVTTTLYTDTGKPEFQSNPDGSTNAWRYYLDGRIYREIQRNGAYWQTAYDDYNRIMTRIFCSAAGIPEATNSTQVDRRGNVIQKTDAGGNVFTTAYDGLDRVKTNAGPVVVTVNSYLAYPTNSLPTFVTNTLQQTVTSFYDSAGRAVTNVNGLGETSIAISDAIGRLVSSRTYNAGGTLAHEEYYSYSPDHNSVTVTNGSGPTAIVTTAFTDTEGHTACTISYPAPGVLDYTYMEYDLAGAVWWREHDTSIGGVITTNTIEDFYYDSLLRLATKIDRDGAETDYYPDAMGNVTNRNMPGSLQWQATYNNTGQMLKEKYINGTSGTRTNTYTYFSTSTAVPGLLQTKTDGRGVTCAYSYDDWLRATNMAYSGSLLEQDLTTTLHYEPRGFVTNTTEQFSSTNTGPVTTVQRSYDAYGQLASESVNGGPVAYGDSQNWDVTGRRTQLTIGGVNYAFGWQADGNLVSASDPTGTGNYTFDTAGLLTTRQVGNRMTVIGSRDGEGHPLSVTNLINLSPQLTESITWSGDGLLATHTLARTDFTDSRSYAYAGLSRRLTQEQLNLNGSAVWTNTMAYDKGVAAGLGVLTQMGQITGTSNKWTGVADVFARIATETNSTSQYAAYGHVNGQSTLSAWLDNQPASVTGVGTNAMQWRATMELTPGAHHLTIAALHPSGFYTAWATNSFTNNIAYQTTADTFDNAGNITKRIWKSASGKTNLIQTLSWDARGRLHAITQLDTNNNGYTWSAIYDGLNRRLSTTSILMSNGVALSATPITINSYFDPQVEFLELGVSYGITTEWKLYGPSLNGKYGGMNGVGGLDAVSPYLNLFNPLLSDCRGNIMGVITNGVLTWNPARPTAFGAVPGYRPLPLGNGANISLASAWRGKWADITGYYQLGLRPYDPISGRWLTYDSVPNDNDPNAYTFCGGDPIDHFDSDGRCIESGASAVGNFYYNGGPAGYVLNGIGNALNSYSGNNAYLGAYGAYLGTLYNEAGSMVSPSTYANGLSSFGNNINTVYQSDGIWAAGSYATTSWNVGAVWSGAANINLATGQPVGNGVDQAEDILGGIAGTAGVAAGGVSLFNWATAPAATAPATATATADATPASTPIGQSGSPLNVSTADGVPSNTPSTVSGIDYSGHALDQMQSDGIMPSAVQNTINQGQSVVGKVAGTTVYYEPVNNITVVTDASSGRVVTVSYGQIRQ